MAEPTTVDLGAFAAGEVPPDLQVTFKDFDGVPVPLTGFTPHMRITEELAGDGGLGGGAISITDAPNGVAEYQWVRADMLNVGQYTAQAWVEDGNKYYASDLYTYTVYDGPGDPPA